FTVVWESATQDGNGSGIFGRRVDGLGAMPIGFELLINQTTTGNQSGPSVAATASGEVLVTWRGDVGVGTDVASVFGRRLSASMPIGFELLINRSTDGTQRAPDLAPDPGRDFVVVWQTDAGLPATQQVLERRNVLSEIFVDGFESGTPGRWSSTTPRQGAE
ncbi:MAG: hypothetical protein MI919_12700, partial [Holophagales bacterium]|nr:hypothetical protein [Holophagales bacterium]